MAGEKDDLIKLETSSLEKMTWRYFHPWWYVPGGFANLLDEGVPTIDEIAFLGTENVQTIQKEAVSVEETIRKSFMDVKSAQQLLLTRRAQFPVEASVCDWRGKGHAPISMELENELRKIGAYDIYTRLVENHADEIFVCRYGREVADWCKKSPSPLSCEYKCYLVQEAIDNAKATAGEADMTRTETKDYFSLDNLKIPESGVPKCACFEACFGNQPFVGEKCIIELSLEAIDECLAYVDSVVEHFMARLAFMEQYRINLMNALRLHPNVKKPLFAKGPLFVPLGTEDGTRLVEISSLGCNFRIENSIYATRMLEADNFYITVINNFGDYFTGGGAGRSYIEEHDHGAFYLTRDDFDYLIKHPGFRQVWLRMTRFCSEELTAEDLSRIFEYAASFGGVSDKLGSFSVFKKDTTRQK